MSPYLLVPWVVPGSILCTALVLIWAVRSGLSRSKDRDARRLGRLLEVQLSGVMQAMGLEPAAYLGAVSSDHAERRIGGCGSCQHRSRCAADLGRAADERQFGYCPVHRELREIRNAVVGLPAPKREPLRPRGPRVRAALH